MGGKWQRKDPQRELPGCGREAALGVEKNNKETRRELSIFR